MIYIGVTGWGDHDTLYRNGIAARDKLKEYAAHFPTVEVDASFYAIQPEKNTTKWVQDTPEGFRFVVKAYQGMTGHQRGEIPFASKEEMFDAFLLSSQPFVKSGKLAMVLFQFPPWFDCTKENVAYLRYCREKMHDIPVALEFRNQTWFYPQYKESTLRFMEEEGWIHSICDEPQAGLGSVPTILHSTNKEKTLIRLHGRNVAAWMKPNGNNWREVRYLYRYNKEELLEWKKWIVQLQKETKDIYVLFNNNSGGDAADNAKQFIELLGIEYAGLASKQLGLF
ncbi:DUF72 domain-containing protein [Lederbergia wuyishanensis]|uniref:Uncharacterized protein YecE (DUF72 family) n=1 Tax=Lederbergia wuyishanensis TaxID=1347903 RepID=A0ABU0D949_9BACI|nr:DUF72 domain-containing protein [Lederbergia wuyishanensis]MCJ8009433.1 DUF72 domain-containing protein [Lederbergia wuyishanensis]MDQ0344957.1 uncharacterized protein YecE (DUF72 family) [Lederbergia wuyishanensis]